MPKIPEEDKKVHDEKLEKSEYEQLSRFIQSEHCDSFDYYFFRIRETFVLHGKGLESSVAG